MSTKIQIRRGLAATWTSSNPVLSSGEIGFETDTYKLKIGNGSSTWTALNYFSDIISASSSLVSYIDQRVSSVIDGAPDLLNTLNELAAALGDNPDVLSTFITSNTASSTYLTQAAYASASPNFATDAELANKLDTSTYASASANFATDAELASAIVTASAAAVAYADGLTTADVAENTNLYFTNERAINAGSATYILQSSQQGIINSASAAAVTAVLDGAPGALDTLNELAAALNDDSSFATTVTNSLAAKLDASSASTTYATIASPTFTGTVTIPTLDLTNALPIADGGTGATTASAAFNALAPSQASNSGKYLTTNGTTTSWATVEGGGGGGGTASDDTIFKAQLFFGGSN
jgi:hypothetical protein